MSRAPVIALALVGCSGVPSDTIELANGAGKADAVSIGVRLTESNPVVSMTTRCDDEAGCEGWLSLSVVSPDPCTLLDDPRCGITSIEPSSVELGALEITSSTEGERTLPLRIETADGSYFSSEVSAEFTGGRGEEVEFVLEKAAGAPDIAIDVKAEWVPREDPGAEVSELEAFLATVPGLRFEEIFTAYQGYRAYSLWYEQPLDHDDPEGRTFTQRMVLHHRDAGAPTVLYTSGYSLFVEDYLSELSESTQANQLSTEQRFFGSSRPEDLEVADWSFVTIAQAAADHHRIALALRSFYSGSWVSTGHSKGGMTSIYHRRFYPEDVDATVAYVAPISYDAPDSRYIEFLDEIGEAECRQKVRDLQARALEHFDELLVRTEDDWPELSFERSGGRPAAFEEAIVAAEWSFWQNRGLSVCGELPDPSGLDVDQLYWLVENLFGIGLPDSEVSSWEAYHYQAETELGLQDLSVAHLEDDLQYYPAQRQWYPEGTEPVHDRAAMDDIQDWVKSDATEVLFIYGEYDPWTGGAFEVPEVPSVVSVTAPKANHGANIVGLDADTRERALDLIADWTGARPALGPQFRPQGAPVPPGLGADRQSFGDLERLRELDLDDAGEHGLLER